MVRPSGEKRGCAHSTPGSLGVSGRISLSLNTSSERPPPSRVATMAPSGATSGSRSRAPQVHRCSVPAALTSQRSLRTVYGSVKSSCESTTSPTASYASAGAPLSRASARTPPAAAVQRREARRVPPAVVREQDLPPVRRDARRHRFAQAAQQHRAPPGLARPAGVARGGGDQRVLPRGPGLRQRDPGHRTQRAAQPQVGDGPARGLAHQPRHGAVAVLRRRPLEELAAEGVRPVAVRPPRARPDRRVDRHRSQLGVLRAHDRAVERPVGAAPPRDARLVVDRETLDQPVGRVEVGEESRHPSEHAARQPPPAAREIELEDVRELVREPHVQPGVVVPQLDVARRRRREDERRGDRVLGGEAVGVVGVVADDHLDATPRGREPRGEGRVRRLCVGGRLDAERFGLGADVHAEVHGLQREPPACRVHLRQRRPGNAGGEAQRPRHATRSSTRRVAGSSGRRIGGVVRRSAGVRRAHGREVASSRR